MLNVYVSIIFSRQFGSACTYICNERRLPALRATKAPFSCTGLGLDSNNGGGVNKQANRERGQLVYCDCGAAPASLCLSLQSVSCALWSCPLHTLRRALFYRSCHTSVHRRPSPQRSCCAHQHLQVFPFEYQQLTANMTAC